MQQPTQEVEQDRTRERLQQAEPQQPALDIALIMLTRNRLPVRLITGVWPTGAHDRPAAASERPISSSHNTTRRPAGWAQLAGYSSSSQRRTAAGSC